MIYNYLRTKRGGFPYQRQTCNFLSPTVHFFSGGQKVDQRHVNSSFFCGNSWSTLNGYLNATSPLAINLYCTTS